MATIKSIKKKAEEYDRVIKRINPNESIVDIFGREQFEAGANYVLEEIEKVIFSNSSSCEKAIFELGKLVIQLKE